MSKILVACEHSQEVTEQLIYLGYNAMSCDLNYPGDKGLPHYHGNVFDIINDGWDLMIAFPPCTHLASSGAAWFEEKRKDGRQQQAIEFFLKLVNAPIKHIAIENPVGIMSNEYRPPDQIVHPYYFGDPFEKRTCLWLKNLPKLKHYPENTLFDLKTHVKPEERYAWTTKDGRVRSQPRWYALATNHPTERSKIRSRTFPGFARSMAEQWGSIV